MKESNILKLIELQASKCGYLTLRLNSGMFYQGKLNNTMAGQILTNLRHINGCPDGTSDLLIIAPNGKVIFCETKTAKGKQRESQKKFQVAVEKLGHTYILARKVEDLCEVLND